MKRIGFIVAVSVFRAVLLMGCQGNSQELVFVDSRNQVCFAGTDGKNLKQLTLSGVNRAPRWSPDRTKVVFTSNAKITKDANGITFETSGDLIKQCIYIADVNGHDFVKLTEGDDKDPAFSPDGKSIICVHSDETGSHLFVMDLNGKNIQKLTQGTFYYSSPAFSPDGKKIAVCCLEKEKTCIYVMDSDGRNAKRLTNDSFGEYSPCFSRDGSKILFSSDRGGGTKKIYIVNADGSRLEKLTDSQHDDSDPVSSTDGKRIAFSRFEVTAIKEGSAHLSKGLLKTLGYSGVKEGYEKIYIMDIESGNTHFVTYGNSPSWR